MSSLNLSTSFQASCRLSGCWADAGQGFVQMACVQGFSTLGLRDRWTVDAVLAEHTTNGETAFVVS